jgi:AraC-like DNA-binding protein
VAKKGRECARIGIKVAQILYKCNHTTNFVEQKAHYSNKSDNMDNKLDDILKHYLNNANNGSIYVANGEYAIIDKPTFSIVPNHPYRNPLTVGVYCTSWSGKGRVNTKVFDLTQNSLMIVLPGQITELIDVSEDFSATYIIMTDSFINSLGIGNTFSLNQIVASSPYISLEERAKDSLENYLTMCRNLIPQESNPHRLEILQLLTRAFFLGLGYFIHKVEEQNNIASRSNDVTKEFIELVEEHYTRHRELSFYANKLNITAKHLSRTVKETSGKHATEWIEKYVILDAITQLLSTKTSIKEIAYRLNFPSQSCFGKYFQRIAGVSPAAYRAQHKK